VLVADPGDVVEELGGPGGALSRASLGEGCEVIDGEIRESVEEDVALDVLEVQAVGEFEPVEGEGGAGRRVADAAAKFVEQVGPDGRGVADNGLLVIGVPGVGGQEKRVGAGGGIPLLLYRPKMALRELIWWSMRTSYWLLVTRASRLSM
jgi:hypothetical protein